MQKEGFDYYWKVIIIILLILGMIYMFWEFKSFNSKGLECAKQPFLYGARQMAERYGEDGFMDCFCTVGNKDETNQYSFNEIEENPKKNDYFLDFDLNNLNLD